ncbi:MAG: caspase family protein [Saprospiraceae bacterium]|nr:caspase family protein [Saprospiraceae bacterium]
MKKTLVFCWAFLTGYVQIQQISAQGDSIQPRLVPPAGHTGAVTSACFSPDGQLVLTGSSDGTAKLWDMRTGLVLDDVVKSGGNVRFSPDGKHFLTAYHGSGSAYIWHTPTGKLVHKLDGKHGNITTVDYSPNGKHVVTAGLDKTVKIWDAETGNLLHEIKGHSRATFSPDSRLVAVRTADSTARIWNVQNDTLIQTLKGHKHNVLSCCFSPDSRYVATASRDTTVKLWDARTGELIRTLMGHTQPVLLIVYSPDGRYLLSGSNDSTARVWDALTGNLVHILIGHENMVGIAEYSPDGSRILTGSQDHTARVWEAGTGNLVHTLAGHKEGVGSAKFSRDGRFIVTTGGLDYTAKVWDVATGKMIRDLKGRAWVSDRVWCSPDGRQFAAAYRDSTVRIWDISTGKVGHVLGGHRDFVVCHAYSPDSRNIATGSRRDNVLKVWDAGTGKLLETFTVGNDTTGVYAISYSPDGQSVCVATTDLKIAVWDVKRKQVKQVMRGHYSEIFSVSFSPDSRFIISGSRDKTVRIWDASSGDSVRTLAEHSWIVYDARFSPDGRYMATASGDHTAGIWETATGKRLFTLKNPTLIPTVDFSPDGRFIVTACFDGTATVWETATGTPALTLSGHKGGVTSARYSHDGQFIVTSSWDGTIRYWNPKTGAEILAIYLLNDSDWVVMHTSGLFDATPGAMKSMYYLVEREVIEFEQLKERYYEPGLFLNATTLDGRGFRDVKLFDSVEMYPEAWAIIENDTLRIRLRPRNGGIGKVSMFVNSKEVLEDVNAPRDTALSIALTPFEKYYRTDTLNQISLRVYNSEGWLKSNALALDYSADFLRRKGTTGAHPVAVETARAPRYFAVVVGTSDYNGSHLDLRYADKDSRDMAHALRQTAGLLFGADKVRVDWFSTDIGSGSRPANKENIRAAFDSIAGTARPEDVLVVYFSGHGVTFGAQENEQFYYLTKDVSSGDLTDPVVRTRYTISTNELTRWLNSIAAQKQVMILDACSSGKVVDDLLVKSNILPEQARALDRMKDRTGMFVLAGSAADKVSYEASRYGQGLLTYSLLLGISGAALREGKSVDVMQLFQFARDQVPLFAGEIGGIQTPTLAAPANSSSYDIGLVTEDVQIPLASVKPVFIRSNFQEENLVDDVIGLSSQLDARLLDASVGATSRGIIFFDVIRYDDAYSIKGRYTLDGELLTVRGIVFNGKIRKGEFTRQGNRRDLEGLTAGIVAEAIALADK